VTQEPKPTLELLTLEGLELALELKLRGYPSYKDTSSLLEEAMKELLEKVLDILRREDETASLENLGGLGAVRRLSNLIKHSQELPEHQRPALRKSLMEQLQGEFLGEEL